MISTAAADAIPAPPAPVALPRALVAACALVALIAVALPAWIVTHAPAVPRIAHRVVVAARVIPPAELPSVDPLAFQNLDPADARAWNASVPFSTEPNPAARPFKLQGSDDDRARAIDCLAAAEIYEAGDDTTGERAVAQVVLNRVRHPAFPKTICGVVFQGSERTTGCQFTFACDGALGRWRPSDAAWKRAVEVATAALTGSVDKPVGYATHYHTDWVVPYWSSSLDKIAAVGTHLFFRWTGWWGTPPAFKRHVLTEEPVIAALAPLSPAHATAAALSQADVATAEAAAAVDVSGIAPVAGDPNSFLVTLDPKLPPAGYAALAEAACGDRAYCKFSAWSDAADTPRALPLGTLQVASMAFSYFRDRAHDIDKALWNCTRFPRLEPNQCLKMQVFAAPTPTKADPNGSRSLFAAPVPVAPADASGDAPAGGLAGIRRKPTPEPAASPKPAIAGPPR